MTEVRDVVAQLAEQQRLVRRHWSAGRHADRLVADLPPVAVRAGVRRDPSALGTAGSSSTSPVATSNRRARTDLPSASATVNTSPSRAAVMTSAVTTLPP